ncbi:sugar phosphate isomerase/epimerase family protein [Streptomyces chattanoogensis]|uniref:Sugar phosphate isomerase n=1 Tax=Streptomyces chattanoogensis TaxID=66876 RepID=A0A0N0XWU3_9ACTN|nr:sugar phosphate isomerase/epimerase [Streptomyces chattanoogensis]KPC64354.1 sugar phosphate isomerase [Streptomyces chattanoogensis]
MKLGFLTACLPSLSLDEIAAWAAEHDYQALEVATWPATGSRDSAAAHLDVARFGEADADRVRALFDRHGLELSAFAYYENNLHPDEHRRTEIAAHLRHNIDAASLLGVPYVGTFVGRDPGRTVKENIALAEKELPQLVDYANERGVKIIIENCLMAGWHPDGYPGNLAYSPELWEWMFSLGLYLNYNPSHLIWQGIDPVEALRPYVDHIPHARAKDTQIDPVRRNRHGIFGKSIERDDPWDGSWWPHRIPRLSDIDWRSIAGSLEWDDPWDNGWWRHRIPGLGDIDWRCIVDTLYEGGFTGVFSVEHEDPVWSGDEQKAKDGLRIAHRTLRPLILT